MAGIGFSIVLVVLLPLSVLAQSGIITTYVGPGLPIMGALATTQALDTPTSVAPDGAGGFYVVSQYQNRVYRVAADGRLSLAAGSGVAGFSGDGGPATAAQLNSPSGVAVDAAGNLYIADAKNNRIRKVTASGVISTVAGNGAYGFSGDGGPATAAQLDGPYAVAVDSTGSLYITDAFNDRIRKVTTAGVINIVAGNGTYGFSGDGGPSTAAQLYDPADVVVDSAGNLFIADNRNSRIRKVAGGQSLPGTLRWAPEALRAHLRLERVKPSELVMRWSPSNQAPLPTGPQCSASSKMESQSAKPAFPRLPPRLRLASSSTIVLPSPPCPLAVVLVPSTSTRGSPSSTVALSRPM